MMSYVFVTIIIAGVILNEIKVVSAKGILLNSISLITFPKFMDLNLNPAVKLLCDMTTDQLIKYYGYEVDSYNVTTEDGYILTVFRCYSKEFAIDELEPILLQHGMMDTSDSFCLNPGIQSLAYFFASKKYLVYMPNSRGNRYSRAHQTLDPNQIPGEFWDFSFTEMGVRDLPVVIDSILEQTGMEKIACIGHSQGATIFLILLSLRPEYNDKIKLVSMMAPFSYMNNVGFPLNAILEFFSQLLPFKDVEFVPNSLLQRTMSQIVCQIDNGTICNSMINFVLGPSVNQRNNSMLPVYLCHLPAGSSINQFIHFGQEVARKYFGPMIRNILGKTPKDFPIHRITAPISIHYSPTDPHTNTLDIEKLRSNLQNVIDVQEIIDVKFDHVDFIWGAHAHEIVYSRIYKLLKNQIT